MFLQVFCSDLGLPKQDTTASISAICSSHRKSLPHFAAASKRNSIWNTPRILTPGLKFSICAEELMQWIWGCCTKTERNFYRLFSAPGKGKSRSCGTSLTRKNQSQKGKHGNAEMCQLGTVTAARYKSQGLPGAIQGPGSEILFVQHSQTE